MDPATIAISLNVLSNVLYDLLKRAKGSSGLSPVDAAIARTVASFPTIEGLKTTLDEWLVSPGVTKTLDDFTKGLSGPRELRIDVLADALIERTRFFLPDGGETARQIISTFLLEVRDQYLRIPELALPMLGNRMEAGFRDTSAGIDSLMASLEDVKVRGLIRPAITDGSGFDSQIDEAKSHLQQYDYELAQNTCERLRQRRWDELSPRQRFRVLSILGATNLSQGRFDAAARAFIEAKEFQPDDPTALGNEARAYHFLGRTGHAFDLAALAKERFPNSSLVLTVWLDVAPTSTPLKDLLDAVPPYLADDAEVATILARRALILHENAEAEALARRAIKTKPDWSYPWAVLGETIFRSLLPDASVDYGRMSTLASRPRLVEGDEACTKAIELSKTEKQVNTQAGILLVRGELRRGLADESAGDEDVITAYSLDPEDPTVVREYGRLKLRRGEVQDAIRILRSELQEDSRPDLKLLLANALSGIDQAGARQEALPLYKSLLADPSETDFAFRMHVIEAVLADLAKDQRWDEGRSILAQLKPATVSAAAFAAFQSRLELTSGNREKASTLATSARDALDDDARHDDLRLIAILFADLGRDRDAFPLWQRLAATPDLGFDTSRLIDCALRLGEHGIFLSICDQLRKKGQYDKDLVHAEVGVRERDDIEGAIRILQEYLARAPEDRTARLQLSDIGLRLNRPELVVSDPASMPAPDDVPHENWKLIVHVIKSGGHLIEALRFAYRVLRGHFDDPEAHRAYLASLLVTGPRPDIPVTVESVVPGTAVAFIEDRTSLEEWRVIEEEYEPNASLQEIGPDHFIARELVGKRVGDTFLLARGSVTSRAAKITQILDKHVYRFQDCIGNFQKRFPELPDIQSVRMGIKLDPSGVPQPDLTEFFASFDKIVAHHESALDAYRSQPLPVHLLAKMSGHSDFEEYVRIALDESVIVRCCDGSAPEHVLAIAALKTASTVVLDLSALATLALLDALDELSGFQCSVAVSELTLAELANSFETGKFDGREMGCLGKESGRYVFETRDPESLDRQRALVQTMVEKVRSHCTIEGCPELAAVAPDKRVPLIKLIGGHSAQSVLLASLGFCIFTPAFLPIPQRVEGFFECAHPVRGR